MQEKIGNSITTIPVPNHKEVKPGRLKSINWQSKLPTKDLSRECTVPNRYDFFLRCIIRYAQPANFCFKLFEVN
jgi:hypothetical protein